MPLSNKFVPSPGEGRRTPTRAARAGVILPLRPRRLLELQLLREQGLGRCTTTVSPAWARSGRTSRRSDARGQAIARMNVSSSPFTYTQFAPT